MREGAESELMDTRAVESIAPGILRAEGYYFSPPRIVAALLEHGVATGEAEAFVGRLVQEAMNAEEVQS